MRRSFQSVAVLFLTVLILSVFPSCTQHTLSNQAMALNKTVHEHRVDQLLLNVIRASRYEPTAMTTIGSFVQRNSTRGTVGVGFPFGRLAPDRADADISASVQRNPEMTLTILDNQEKFIDGFMRPISGQTIAFFVKQGWEMELLAFLLVEAVEKPLEDFPAETWSEMAAKYPSRIRRREMDRAQVRIPNDPGSDNRLFEALIRENVNRLEIRTVPSRNGGAPSEEFMIPGVRSQLVIRSPHGVINYLGELARLCREPNGEARIPTVKGEPLFLVRRHQNNPGNIGVSVMHRGVWYAIPENERSYSLAALNLVQQLIDLQEKEIDPNPSTVRFLPN